VDAAAKAKAQEFKAAGNDAFSAGKYEEAINQFTLAILEDGNDHVFYSNRSASYANLGQFDRAQQDGLKCIEIKPDWAKVTILFFSFLHLTLALAIASVPHSRTYVLDSSTLSRTRLLRDLAQLQIQVLLSTIRCDRNEILNTEKVVLRPATLAMLALVGGRTFSTRFFAATSLRRFHLCCVSPS
jgi:tetratricopeptide (TPR) repeat protein